MIDIKIEINKQLITKGFVEMNQLRGINFPGIDSQEIDEAVKTTRERLKESKDKEPVSVPDLTLSMGRITDNYFVPLNFNQKTFKPREVNQDLYREVFRIGA